MKIYRKAIPILSAVLLLVSMTACSNTKEESSIPEEVVVINKTLSLYEKNIFSEAVEIPLNIACTTLYECVCTGSITQKTASSLSFAASLPLDNSSPSEKRRIAESLTMQNAIEYFNLTEIYSDENIREYAYLTATYTDADLIKGTVINISRIQKADAEYQPFTSTNIRLGDFINGTILLAR